LEIIQRIAERLIGAGFGVVNGLCPPQLTGETSLAGLQKRTGMVLNVVVIADCDHREDYATLFDSIIRQVSTIDSKVTVLGIFCSCQPNDRLKEFCTVDTDIYSDKNDIRWIVDTGSGTLDTDNGNQPNDFLNIQNVIKEALSAEGELTPIDMASVKARADEEYRSQHIKTDLCLLTYVLIGINVLLYILSVFIPQLSDGMAVSYEGTVWGGEWYRLITYMFMHGGITHLAANSMSLYIIGSRAERAYGRGDYALIYAVTGVCGGLASIFGNGVGVYSVGASAAICGLLGAVICYSFIKKTHLGGLDWATLIIFALVSIGGGALETNVDNYGHLGGFVSGLALGAVLSLLSGREKAK
jgi:membrane associated rhomboid family serine protease